MKDVTIQEPSYIFYFFSKRLLFDISDNLEPLLFFNFCLYDGMGWNYSALTDLTKVK